jgi:hypothetical protein
MAVVALIAVTAVWGVTFVQVKDAVELYPLFAFLATATLALPAARRLRTLGRSGIAAGALLGLLLASGYVLQTAGLQRTTVSSTGFVTGMYVVLTPPDRARPAPLADHVRCVDGRGAARGPLGRAGRGGDAQGRGSEAAYTASLSNAGRAWRPWTCTATTREPLKTVPV